MQKRIKIFYGELLDKEYDIILSEEQQIKQIISRVVKELKLKKLSFFRSGYGYKLVNAKDGCDIDNESDFFQSSIGDSFLLLPDEKKEGPEVRNCLLVISTIIYGLIKAITTSIGIRLGGIPTFIIIVVLFSLAELISKKIEKSISEQNAISIERYLEEKRTNILNTSNNSQPHSKNNVIENSKDLDNNICKQSDESKENLYLNETTSKNDSSNNDNNELGFYFNNIIEFALYVREKNNIESVTWLKGDAYENAFKRIYLAFEKAKYGEVITLGEKCFEINPIAISVRFEICEAYLALHKIRDAEERLTDMYSYMVTNYDIAKYYRTWGYIMYEKKQWKESIACYKYSLKFDNNINAAIEIEGIKKHTGLIDYEPSNFTEIFNICKIPYIDQKDIISVEEAGLIIDKQDSFNEFTNDTEKTINPTTSYDDNSNNKTDNTILALSPIEFNNEEDNNSEKISVENSSQILFCRKCGAKLIENSLFCNKCGTKVIIMEK